MESSPAVVSLQMHNGCDGYSIHLPRHRRPLSAQYARLTQTFATNLRLAIEAQYLMASDSDEGN